MHHCKDDYLMLSKWLLTDKPNNLPNYSSHYIGAGGVVYNPETNQFLMVKEKNGNRKNKWGLP